jgi:uncharacterized membrane protein YeaQ/YmgE (transglycosylase-associated protein family)
MADPICRRCKIGMIYSPLNAQVGGWICLVCGNTKSNWRLVIWAATIGATILLFLHIYG